VRKADNLITSMCLLSRNVGGSASWNAQGLSRAVMGVLYLFTSVYVYIDVLNYGTISHTFGVLVSGCIHMRLNCKLAYIGHIHVYVEISDYG
jgi:hypothetical protein